MTGARGERIVSPLRDLAQIVKVSFQYGPRKGAGGW